MGRYIFEFLSFNDSSLNRDLIIWDVGQVTYMSIMFYGLPFNGDLN